MTSRELATIAGQEAPKFGACAPFVDPALDASDAIVFWRPELSSCVLPILAVPARGPTDIPFISAAKLRCRMTVFATPRSLQQVVFLTAGRRLQLVVRGGDIRDRVRLVTYRHSINLARGCFVISKKLWEFIAAVD